VLLSKVPNDDEKDRTKRHASLLMLSRLRPQKKKKKKFDVLLFLCGDEFWTRFFIGGGKTRGWCLFAVSPPANDRSTRETTSLKKDKKKRTKKSNPSKKAKS
jgi:hypothetical protein